MTRKVVWWWWLLLLFCSTFSTGKAWCNTKHRTKFSDAILVWWNLWDFQHWNKSGTMLKINNPPNLTGWQFTMQSSGFLFLSYSKQLLISRYIVPKGDISWLIIRYLTMSKCKPQAWGMIYWKVPMTAKHKTVPNGKLIKYLTFTLNGLNPFCECWGDIKECHVLQSTFLNYLEKYLEIACRSAVTITTETHHYSLLTLCEC